MGKHALLSASSSHRWLNCPPSARLGESFADKSSDFAAEGTDAHTLCEYKLKAALGMPAEDPTEDLGHFNFEMEECANAYATFVLEQVETARKTCPDPLVLIEQRLDFSRYVENGFGTGDCVLISDGTLHVVDFKYGQGILVEAQDNPQMKLYALGALEIFDCLYDIQLVAMTIFQPRRDNVSTHTVYKESLYQWADEVLKPTADLAYAGEGTFSCGEWCRFCKARQTCRARAEYNLDLARFEFKAPPLLSDDELGQILAQADELMAWASDVKEYAFREALSGKQWSGWKLVEGRANRRYTDEHVVAAAVSAAGFDPHDKKVLGITAMTTLLGKSRFEEIVSAFIEKPKGKPTLVPASDKRPAIHTAQADFSE